MTSLSPFPFSPPATPTLLQSITLKLIPSPLQLLLLHTYECKCMRVCVSQYNPLSVLFLLFVCKWFQAWHGTSLWKQNYPQIKNVASTELWESHCSQRTDLLENGPIPLSHGLKFWPHQVYGYNGYPSPFTQLVWYKQVTEPFLAHLVQQIRVREVGTPQFSPHSAHGAEGTRVTPAIHLHTLIRSVLQQDGFP